MKCIFNRWSRMLIVVALMLGMLALTACGNRSRNQAAESVDSAESQAEMATEPSQDAEPATEAPVAEEPAAEDTSDVDANATATADAQIASLGGGDSDTTTPSEEPAASDSDVTTGVLVEGACRHPYYPVVDGVVYRYQLTTLGVDSSEMTMEYVDAGPDAFKVIQNFEGKTSEVTWQCTDEGLLSTDFVRPDIPGVEYSLGGTRVTFPTAEQLQPGHTWQSVLAMSGTMSMEGQEVAMKIEAVSDNEMSGFEDVTTPAGTFRSAKIDTMTTMDMQFDFGEEGGIPGMPEMPPIEMPSTMWLAEDVGMIKSISGGEIAETVMELTAIE